MYDDELPTSPVSPWHVLSTWKEKTWRKRFLWWRMHRWYKYISTRKQTGVYGSPLELWAKHKAHGRKRKLVSMSKDPVEHEDTRVLARAFLNALN